jgi:hypothetical protein
VREVSLAEGEEPDRRARFCRDREREIGEERLGLRADQRAPLLLDAALRGRDQS